MNEYAASVIILVGFGILSYVANLIIRKSNLLLAVTGAALYLAITCFYYVGIFKLHLYLKDKGFYIEFGHADLLLVILFYICIVVAVINIGLAALYKDIG